MRYIKRIFFIFYYILNFFKFKRINFKTNVFFSVRIQGAKYISLYKYTTIQRQSWLGAFKIDEHDPELIIEEGCAIGDFAHITAVRKVHIERDVLLANNVYISDNLHSFEDVNVPIIKQAVVFKSAVIIKSGAWIGENVCIIGASVGKNSVIGANSVVTKDIPDFCIAVGSPAKVIKQYDKQDGEWKRC
jgi:acetyltransferase-like isoleucine patch superfamily enzyme